MSFGWKCSASLLSLLLVGCGRLLFESTEAAPNTRTVTPLVERCMSYRAPSMDLCSGAPLFYTQDGPHIVFEAIVDNLPVGYEVSEARLRSRVDISDDGNANSPLAVIQMMPDPFSETSRGEMVLGAELNEVPPPNAPSGGQTFEVPFDGRYIRASEPFWLTMVGQSRAEPHEVFLTRGETRLELTLGPKPPDPTLVDDSLLDAGVRTVFANYSGCRNLSVEASTRNECRYGALKIDSADPDVFNAYLHFEVPPAPVGMVLQSAGLQLTTSRGVNADGSSGTEVSLSSAFTPLSLDTPGASGTPSRTALAADVSRVDVAAGERVTFALYDGVVREGDVFLALSFSGDNAVWYYSHEPPRGAVAERPRLVVQYQ